MAEFWGIGYKNNIVDIHCHVLPGCDDGCGTMKESMQTIHAAAREGVRDLIVTPHYGAENGYAPDSGMVKERFEELKEAVSDDMVLSGLRLYLGEEVYCSDDADEEIKAGKALRINDTRYVLVEFLEYGSMHESGEVMLERLKKLQHIGLPILAHPERYESLQCNRDYLKRIRDLGVLFQVNAYDLSESTNKVTRELAQWMAKERMISFLGSDAHGMPPKREPKLRSGVEWLYKNTNEQYADAVVRGNAEKELRIKKYSSWDDSDYFTVPWKLEYFSRRLNGLVVRCQVFPQSESHRISRAVLGLEDGRAYAIVEGIMGPRIFQLEAYADDSNSEFGYDNNGWYWRWKGSGRPVKLKNLGGCSW